MGIVQESFKRLHYPTEIILLCLRWYLSYSLSLRNLEEMMLERGIIVDHSTIHRWILRLSPLLTKNAHKRRTLYGGSWYIDETYIKIKGKWHYLYRAVNASGHTIDFMLSKRRDKRSAKRFFSKAMEKNLCISTANIDKSGANQAALMDFISPHGFNFKIRQCKYKNNIIEQDHRFIKKRCRPMLGFKTYKTAQILIAGIETLHKIHKKQIHTEGFYLNPVVTFYSLVG